jgi:hypothetical protein
LSQPRLQPGVLLKILLILLVFMILPGHPASLAGPFNKKAQKEFKKIKSLNSLFAHAHSRSFLRSWSCFCNQKPRIKKFKALSGPLDRAAIKKVVRDNYGKVHDCYRRYLRWDPKPGGKLKFKIVVRPDGDVDKVTIVEKTALHPEMKKCLLRVLKRFRFPRPDGFEPVEIIYPFVFDP